MILQALSEYYDRKSADTSSCMAPPGFEWKEIPFVIVLKQDGIPVSINSTYDGDGKKRRAKSFLVPQGVKKSSGIASNLFWDNPEYALGLVLKGKPDRVIKQHLAFRKKIFDLGEVQDEGFIAVKKFLEIENKEEMLKNFGDVWTELKDDGGNIIFQLVGDTQTVSERSFVKDALACVSDAKQNDEGSVCIVTGNRDVPERLHPVIKGVYGSQSSGANIVSFNLDAFKSFGKTQGFNAPVGKKTVFAYTTALNHLLAKGSKQRMQVGEASTVFWAEQESDLEKQIPDLFGEPPKDDPDKGVKAVESLFKSVESGAFLSASTNNRFYVLGLSPNASRIAIRFWIVDTVAGMATKIKQHFEDLHIVHGPKERDVFSLFRLLVSIAVQGKAENIPPNIAGATMKAILEGHPYPHILLQAVIRRIRAEREITYPRAALIKACINRKTRFNNEKIKGELHMSLDENNTNVGYRLGRLFAALEKIQQDANPGINATIRDRFYGAASGTPSTVFGNLMRLKNHHLAKIENPGRRIFFEKILSQIIDGIEADISFPPHLNLEDQGRFAIGYYHQMQKFYTKNIEKHINE